MKSLNPIIILLLISFGCIERNHFKIDTYENGLKVISKNGFYAANFILTDRLGNECGCTNLEKGETILLFIDSLYGFKPVND